MTKFIPITPTTLSALQTCPKQFEAKYITKEVTFQETQATIWGNKCHKAMEDALTLDIPIPSEMAFLTPWVDKLKKAEGTLLAETKLAIDKAGNPSDWFSRYLGGIADVVVVNQDRAFIGDLKTGKFRGDPQQLTILTKCILANYPEVDKVNATLFYPHLDRLASFKTTRATFPTSPQNEALEVELIRYEKVLEKGEFKPKPSGLCSKWCDVMSCEHNGKNR